MEEELKEIMKSDDFWKVYQQLTNLCLTEEFRDEVFLSYLNIYKNHPYFFERVLIRMADKLSLPIFSYLLEDEINLQYKDKNNYRNETTVEVALACNIHEKEKMNLFLSKISPIKSFYYSDLLEEDHTNLCTMYLIAGKLELALSIFQDKKFQLIYKKTRFIKAFKKLEQVSHVRVNNFSIEKDDHLVSMIVALIKSDSPWEDKNSFLKKILVDSKIEYFNIALFPMIKKYMTEEEYHEYTSYIISHLKIYEGNNSAYDSLLFRVNLQNIL